MEHNFPFSTFHLKIHAFSRSTRSFIYLCLAYPLLNLVAVVFMIPLFHFFPQLKSYGDWLSLWIIVPMGLLFILMITEALSWCIVTPKEITLYWLGIPLRRIPFSELKLFAAIGDDMDYALCFTSYSVEKMAKMQEAHMLKGFFTQHDVPFRKRHPDWQDSFSKDFLLRHKRSILGLFRDKHIIVMDFNPTLIHILRTIYPDLTYRNYTNIPQGYTMQTAFGMEDVVPCLRPELNVSRIDMQADGIHLCRGKREISCLNAENIKNIVVVDTFRPYSKTTPYHLRILLVTSLTEQELSERAPKRLFDADTALFSDNTQLLAMIFATKETALWAIRHTEFCPICGTSKNISALRALYPHAQWIDLSDHWLKNS